MEDKKYHGYMRVSSREQNEYVRYYTEEGWLCKEVTYEKGEIRSEKSYSEDGEVIK